MSKIASEHLGRQAFVCVRQSTQDQLLRNHESRRRQYGLADRARRLGWEEPVVIDDDLGRSGGGVARPGDLGGCCWRSARGASASSRRSRRLGSRLGGRDWHTARSSSAGSWAASWPTRTGSHDPRLPNDRLLPGHEGDDERDGAVVPHASARPLPKPRLRREALRLDRRAAASSS